MCCPSALALGSETDAEPMRPDSRTSSVTTWKAQVRSSVIEKMPIVIN